MGLHPFPGSAVRQHLGHAKATGLEGVIVAAARKHGVREDVLLAIASRETWIGQMPPLSAGWTGDGGHGRGVMQIDDRAHPQFTGSTANDDHAANALYGASVLASGLRSFEGDYFRALAAYNSGAGNVRKALRSGLSAEHYTAGRDYATDVLARARVISAAKGGVSSSATGGPDWGTIAAVGGGVALILSPTPVGVLLAAVGLLAKAQSEGLIS